jgi:1-phosphatidylinositol phosphodiesterase
MAVQSIAAVASEPQPLTGQNNRSSENFQFLTVPSSGVITSLFTATSGAAGISATLMQDISSDTDLVIASLTQNGTFDASKVKTNVDYYIASPDGAPGNFVVYLQGNV